MTYYEAKFEREAKNHPSDWVILPVGYMSYRLVETGSHREYVATVATVGRKTKVPHLRVVK